MRAAVPFEIDCIQSDNGPEFGRYLTLNAGVRHRKIRKRKPNDNAHIEKFNRTIQDWKNYCKTFPYVGLSSATPVQYLPKMLEYAHKHKCQVHGFAFTSPTKVFQYDFDTVDSTSWMQLFRYGNITMFNGDIPRPIKNYKLK